MTKLQTGVSTDMDFIKVMKEKGQDVNAQFPAETLRKQLDELNEEVKVTFKSTNETVLAAVNEEEPEPKEQVTLTIRTFPEDDDRLIVIDGEESTGYMVEVTKDIGTESTIHIESVGYLNYDGTILFDETKDVRIDMTQISPVGIKIVSEPTRKTYCKYENIDYTGLEVDLLYNDGSTERLAHESLNLQPLVADDDEIIIDYQSEFYDSFNITIEDFRLTVSTSLEKSIEEYKTNDEIVISGKADEDSVARLYSLDANHTFDGYIDFTYDNVTTTIDCTFRYLSGNPTTYMIYIGDYEAMEISESCDVSKLTLTNFNFINANSDTPINYQEQREIIIHRKELFDKISAMYSEFDPSGQNLLRIIVKTDKCYSFEYRGGSSLHLDVIFDDDTSGEVSPYDASDIIGTVYTVLQEQNENN